jgi:nucleotide-binding universal stress UspA family protein
VTDRAALPRFHRLLVALDSSEESVAALETALGLARRLGAEVSGVFVEDAAFSSLGTLDEAVVLDPRTGAARSPDPSAIGREFRALAARVRRSLEDRASRARVRAEFRVVRGAVGAALLAAGEEADVVFLGCAGLPAAIRPRLGRTARAVLDRSRAMVLVAPARPSAVVPVVAIHLGGDCSRDAVRAAAAVSGGARLLVLAGEFRDGGTGPSRGEAARDLRECGTAGEVREVQEAGSRGLAAAVRSVRAGLLVVPADAGTRLGRLLPEVIESLLSLAGCPVLVVR